MTRHCASEKSERYAAKDVVAPPRCLLFYVYAAERADTPPRRLFRLHLFTSYADDELFAVYILFCCRYFTLIVCLIVLSAIRYAVFADADLYLRGADDASATSRHAL